jgi:iron complex transport system ATP-binding protein
MQSTGDAVVVSSMTVVRDRRTILDGVSLAARFGATTALLGRNGAGKSTLLKAVAGVLAYKGEVTVGGRPAYALDAAALARQIAYVPQQSELRAPLSVEEVVFHGRYAHRAAARGSDSDRQAVASALERTQILPLRHRPFTTLSQGERQRVLIARALATRARVLLLDEPTSALDVQHVLRTHALLRDLAHGGYCIVMALHSLQEALDWTDEAVLLDAGRVAHAGPTGPLILDGPVERVYGVRLVQGVGLGFRLDDGPVTARGDSNEGALKPSP